MKNHEKMIRKRPLRSRKRLHSIEEIYEGNGSENRKKIGLNVRFATL